MPSPPIWLGCSPVQPGAPLVITGGQARAQATLAAQAL